MTNRKPLIDKLLDNWPVKVICLVVAIFIYIFHQASLIDKKVFVVPLRIEENGIVMHVGNAPSSVSVVVRANSTDINSVHNTDITAVVNLDHITEKGVYKVPVLLTIADHLMELDPFEVKLKDETIEIDVDRKAVKYVPLKPSVVGEIAYGFNVAEISMNPSVVEVSGPETVLDAVDNLSTTKINISNAETTFTTESYYLESSSIITVENKGPYRATVIVEPVLYEKIFSDIGIVINNLDSNLYIENDLPKVSVLLEGSVKNLENYSLPSNTAYINLKDVKEAGEYSIPVIYNTSSLFILKDKSIDSVNVIVKEKIDETNNEAEIVEQLEKTDEQ